MSYNYKITTDLDAEKCSKQALVDIINSERLSRIRFELDCADQKLKLAETNKELLELKFVRFSNDINKHEVGRS